MDKQITFKDLSIEIKVGVVGGWIALVSYCIAFILGFISGLFEVVI